MTDRAQLLRVHELDGFGRRSDMASPDVGDCRVGDFSFMDLSRVSSDGAISSNWYPFTELTMGKLMKESSSR
jgi:hypothetical protein